MKTERINQIILTTSIALSLLLAVIYTIFTNNTELLREIVGIIQVPLGVIAAYYFGIRYS